MPFKRSLMTDTARELRQKATEAEKLLWDRLRRKHVSGLKFRRQHPIKFYVVDFCCPRVHLIVELDGSVHDDPDNAFLDRERETNLMTWGYAILRIRNQRVLKNIDGVMTEIGEWVLKLNTRLTEG